MTERWRYALNQGQSIGVIFLDFQKAFDCVSNKLTLNTEKSNYVIFHPYQKRINYQVQLKLFDPNTNSVAYLEQQDYVKYLGILIDKNLSWKYHIDYVASKISRTIGIIARLRHFIPLSTLLTIYRSLVAPHLTYGILCSNLTGCNVNLFSPVASRLDQLMLCARSDHFVFFFC